MRNCEFGITLDHVTVSACSAMHLTTGGAFLAYHCISNASGVVLFTVQHYILFINVCCQISCLVLFARCTFLYSSYEVTPYPNVKKLNINTNINNQ